MTISLLIRRILFFVKEASHNIKGNLFTNMVAIFTISLALTILTSFAVFFINMEDMLDTFGADVQVIVYLKEDIRSDSTSPMKEKIRSFTEVDSINYVSKEMAIQVFKNELKGQKGILDELGANPLPSSFEIGLKKPFRNSDGVRTIVAKLKVLEGIDDIHYGQEWVDRFTAFLSFFKAAGLIIGVFLLISTIFIISNTIRLTVYARKEEIDIMRLVGATESFIKTPFFIEGLFEGLAGAILAFIMFNAVRYMLLKNIPASFSSLINIPFPVTDFMIILLGIGTAMGVFGSFISLTRFLKQG